MSRNEFLAAIKVLPAAEQTRAKELAKGIRMQGGKNAFERAFEIVYSANR